MAARELDPSASWDLYWRGSQQEAALDRNIAAENIMSGFWLPLFRERFGLNPGTRILDLACGSGVLAGAAKQISPRTPVYCIDYSQDALLEARRRDGDNICVVADAGQLPFSGGQFDLIVSQFGVEYAGPDAIIQAASLLNPNGVLALVLHIHGGAIYEQCGRSKEAALRIKDIHALALARAALLAAHSCRRGETPESDYRIEEQRLAAAMNSLQGLIREGDSENAEVLPIWLYQAIERIHRRMFAYDLSELLAWIQGMESEIDAYVGRMQAMLTAAVRPDKFRQLVLALQSAGLTLLVEGQITSKLEMPVALKLVMSRLS